MFSPQDAFWIFPNQEDNTTSCLVINTTENHDMVYRRKAAAVIQATLTMNRKVSFINMYPEITHPSNAEYTSGYYKNLIMLNTTD